MRQSGSGPDEDLSVFFALIGSKQTERRTKQQLAVLALPPVPVTLLVGHFDRFLKRSISCSATGFAPEIFLIFI